MKSLLIASFTLPFWCGQVVSQGAESKHATNCDKACRDLATALPSQLFLGKEGNHVFWDEKVRELKTTCRVEPSSSEEVAVAFKVLKDHECHFGIKSGGHAMQPGATNTDGVVVDLGRLNWVELSKDKKSAKIGPGAVWKDVYEALEPQGLYVVGGRVADVGVGGLILGGGISFYSNNQGLAVDHVIDMDIVLPSGDLVTVSETSYSDLYKALKGAGQNNFGIVTSFTLDVYRSPRPEGIWRREAIYTWDKADELRKADYEYSTSGLEKEQYSSNQWTASAWGKEYGKIILLHQHHVNHASVETFPEAYKHYQDIETIPEMGNIKILPYSNITAMLSQASPYGRRNVFAHFSHRPSVELSETLDKLSEEALEKLQDVEGLLYCVNAQSLSLSAAAAASKRRGGNVLGLEDEDGPLVLWLLPWSWKNKEDDKLVLAVMQELVEKTEQAAKDAGLWHPFKYPNYAAPWQSSNPYEGYGKEMYRWLKEVQRKYDPEGIYTEGGLARGWWKVNQKGETVKIRDEL